MEKLTERQQRAFDFIVAYTGEHGYPPTLREIGASMGISSTNGVNDHLKALEKKGYLKREGLKSRALRPVVMPKPEVPRPVIRQTHTSTYVVMELSTAAYEEIRQKMVDAGYDHVFDVTFMDGGDRKIIHMEGIAVADGDVQKVKEVHSS